MALETLRFDGVFNLAIAGSRVAGRPDYRSVYMQVTPGETYMVERHAVEGNRFWVATCSDEPAVGTLLHSVTQSNEALSITVTVPAGDSWLFVYLSNQGDDVTLGNYRAIHEGSGGAR